MILVIIMKNKRFCHSLCSHRPSLFNSGVELMVAWLKKNGLETKLRKKIQVTFMLLSLENNKIKFILNIH